MREELAHLKRVLPERIAETSRTAAFGDRSDNAEYKQAKGSLRHAKWNILSIQDQIKRAVIIPSGRSSAGTVQLGSIVMLEINGKQKRYEILGPHETDPTHGRISYESPLGIALMDHKQGDVITAKTEKGPQKYRILKIH